MSRLSILVFLLFSLCVAVATLLPRLGAPGEYGCLQYEDDLTERTVIDLNTGRSMGGDSSAALPATLDWQGFRPAPDGQRSALIYYDVSNAKNHKLVIALSHTVRDALKIVNDHIDQIDSRDVNWSPDSQWLAYAWLDESGIQRLTVTDSQGRETQSAILSAGQDDRVNLFGWSGDGRYLAVSIEDRSSIRRGIQVWSAPDLKLVKTFAEASSIPDRTFGGPGTSPDNVQWSREGNWLAYLSGNAGQDLTMSLYSPAQDKLLKYALAPVSENWEAELSWSPDGKNVAVVTTPVPDQLIGHIGIFGTDGTVYADVSDSVMHYLVLASGGGGFPLTFWSQDGRSLFFLEQLPSKSESMGSLVAFRVDQGKKVNLSPAVYMNPNTADNHHYLFARFPNDGRDHSQDRSDNESLLLLDTNSFKMLTLNAHNEEAYELQVYGTYAPKYGWLVLTEDVITTWAVNLQTGVERALPPGYTDYGTTGISPDSEFITSLISVDTHHINLEVTSLHDGVTRQIPFSPPEGTSNAYVSPDGQLIGLLTISSDASGAVDVIRSDGSLLRHIQNMPIGQVSFSFTHCT